MRSNLPRVIDGLLSVPLATKLIVANLLVAVLVAAGALAAGGRIREIGSMPDGLLIMAAVGVGLLAIGALDALLIRLALRPVRELERVAERIRAGDLEARPGDTPFADAQIRRVTQVLGHTLDELADLRSRLREVARRAVEARERERRELASVLQDDIAQRIAACLVGLQVARRTRDPDAREEALDELRDEAARLLEEVRETARELRPPELTDIGLGHAVQAFARSFTESTGIEVEVEAEATRDRLDEEGRLALYRVVQDLLMDVVHRTECTDLCIRLWSEPDQVVAELSGSPRVPTVSADGIGPDVASRLMEARERAGYVGGRVVAAEEPADRLVVRAEIPVAGRPAADSRDLPSPNAAAV